MPQPQLSLNPNAADWTQQMNDQSTMLAACPTIRAGARLRRSRRRRRDRAADKPRDDGAAGDESPLSDKIRKAKGARRRRPKKGDAGGCDASTDTASTSPSSDDCLSDSAPAEPKGSRCNRNKSNTNKPGGGGSPAAARRKRSNKSPKGSQRPKVVSIIPELTDEEKGNYIALDCEMVGIGPGGYASRLARVSLVDYEGAVVYDKFVKVEEYVTDYRTFVSGITAEDLESANAVSFDEARDAVKDLIENKILVGHGLKNDFRVLCLGHPWHLTRDTAKYEPFMKTVDVRDATPLYPAGTLVPKKLKVLAKDKLRMIIQEDGCPHSPVQDAVAALELYKKHRVKWERAMEYKVGRTREITGRDRSDSLSSQG